MTDETDAAARDSSPGRRNPQKARTSPDRPLDVPAADATHPGLVAAPKLP